MPYSGGYISDSEDELPLIPLLSADIPAVTNQRGQKNQRSGIETPRASPDSKRSLRPRKAFQLHPYAYDRALYGDYFGKVRASSLDDSQDVDFDFSDPEESSASKMPDNNEKSSGMLPEELALARRRVVDSDSEEITSSSETSESDCEDSQDRKLNFYKRLFSDVVPASKPQQKLESDSGSMDLDEYSHSRSQPATQDWQDSQFSSSLDIPEDRRIDYMLSYGKGKTKRENRRKQVSLVSVVRHMGGSAPDYMQVAARTCDFNGARQDNPDRKFFVLHDGGEEKETLSRWRRGRIGSRNFKMHKQIRDAPSSGRHSSTMIQHKIPSKNTLKIDRVPPNSIQKSIIQAAAGVRPSPVKPALSGARKNGDTKRHRVLAVGSETTFRTPIIEIPAGYAVGSRKRMAATSSNQHGTQELKGVSEQQKLRTSHSFIHFPPMFKLKFMKDTLVGSNTLELLHSVGAWNGETHSEPFGTPIVSATERSLRADFKDIQRIVSGSVGEIDDTLYRKVYAFLLETLAGLVRQDYIIDSDIRRIAVEESISCFSLSLQNPREGISNTLKVQFAVAMFTLVASEMMSLQDPLFADTFKKAKNDYFVFLLDRLGAMSEQALTVRSRLRPEAQVGPEFVILEGGVLFDLMFPNKELYFGRWSGAPECLWSLLFAIGGFHHIRGISEAHWDLVLTILTPEYLQKQQDHKTLLKRILKLIVSWKWPVSAEVVFVFFEYFAREQRYTDSRGESVDLPAFFWAGKFDGTTYHKSEHHYFLELLGLTLSRVDRKQSARIAGRVTPLTSLSFPETQSISASDLSAVSLQYGILIVLSRFAHPTVRPQLIQISDLVKLSHAHVAIRIKAWSAWNIIVRIYILLGQGLSETVTWAENMVGDAHSEYLELRKEGFHQASERVEELFLETYTLLAQLVRWRPQARVLVTKPILLPLPDMPTEVRAMIWETLKSLTVNQLTPLVGCIVQAFTPMSERWEISNWVSIAAIIWPQAMAKEWHIKPLEFEVWSQLILRVGPDPFWIRKLIEGLSLPVTSQPSEYIDSFKQIYPWYSDTLSLVMFLYSSDALNLADIWLDNLHKMYKDLSDIDSKVYRGYVGDVRRSIFQKFPELEDRHRWFQDSEEYNSIEISQRLLLNVLDRDDRSSFEFFIAYKLRSSFEQSNGNTFASEILMSLNLADEKTAMKAFDFVVNDIFAFYVFCAEKISAMERIIPFLLSIVYTLVGRCDRAFFRPYNFLAMVDRHLEYQLARVTFSPQLHALVAGVYPLAVMCLRQAFVGQSIHSVFILLRHRAMHFLERSDDHSKAFPVQRLTAPKFTQDLSTVNILSDLDISSTPEDEESGSREAEIYLDVYRLAQSKA